jgi:hypothetical protein
VVENAEVVPEVVPVDVLVVPETGSGKLGN